MKVGLIGVGHRSRHIYAPVISAMPNLELGGVWSRTDNTARRFAVDFDCPSYPSLDSMLQPEEFQLLIVCVDWRSNAEIYRRISKCDVPVLLETPLATDFAEAVDVARALSNRVVPTEIAEQYPCRPIEVIKRSLIATGFFGDIFYAFNDGVGHEYHGVSLIRSYLGFQQKVRRVAAMQGDVTCFPHVSHQGIFFPGERIQHALLEFESGAMAAHHWSWLAYSSAIRGRRVAGFHGTRGSAWGEEMLFFKDPHSPAMPVRIERRTKVVNGVEVLQQMVAYCQEQTIARWCTSVPDLLVNEDQAVAAGLICTLIGQIKGESDSTYSPNCALEDLRIVDAINRAVAAGSWIKPLLIDAP
jgi:predicted dehydrogenase